MLNNKNQKRFGTRLPTAAPMAGLSAERLCSQGGMGSGFVVRSSYQYKIKGLMLFFLQKGHFSSGFGGKK